MQGALSLDNTALSLAFHHDNMTNKVSIKLNLAELELGLEGATITRYEDGTSTTVYNNYNISGTGIAALVLLLAGNPEAAVQYAQN